jgi:hypothetical protein
MSPMLQTKESAIGGVVVHEVARREAERLGEPREHALAESNDGAHVLVDRARQARNDVVSREEIRPVERNAGDHSRVIRGKVGSDVEALFPIGAPGRELAAEREPPSPGAPATWHREARLDVVGQCEEVARERIDTFDERRIDSMTDDVEEAVRSARLLDRARDFAIVRTEVDDRKCHHWRERQSVFRYSSTARRSSSPSASP